MLATAPARHYVFLQQRRHLPPPGRRGRGAGRCLTAPRGATLWFNYRNARTERWGDADLRKKSAGYQVEYPADDTSGAVLKASRPVSRPGGSCSSAGRS